MNNEKLAGLTRYSGTTISNSYALESEEFFLARKVESLLATTSTEPAQTEASGSPVPRAQGGNTCGICGESEPRTGACGSSNPSALCNLAASPAAAVAAPAPAPVAGSQHVPAAELSKHLREVAADPRADAISYLKHRMVLAADEIDRLAAAAPAVPVPAEQDQAQDAARYRWIRRADYAKLDAIKDKRWKGLDEAVDAAMAAPSLQQPKTGSQP